MTFTIRKATNLSDADLEALTAVFDAAFATERAFKTVTGTAENSSKQLSALNRSQLVAGRLAGEIYIAEDSTDGHVIGGIVWFGPGREIYDSDDQRQLALGPMIEQMPDDVKQWQGKVIPVLDDFKKSVFGDAARMQWYLQRIGVSPEWQGKGVGTALIEELRNKNDGMCISLQSVEPQNLAYYEGLGFKQKGHIDVVGLHGEFTLRAFMWEP